MFTELFERIAKRAGTSESTQNKVTKRDPECPQLDQAGIYDYDGLTKRIAPILTGNPNLLHCPNVQKKILEVIKHHLSWKNGATCRVFIGQIQSLFTPELLASAPHTTTEKFAAALQKIYLSQSKKHFKYLVTFIKDRNSIVDGHLLHLPEGLADGLANLRQFQRELAKAPFAKDAKRLHRKIDKAVQKWDKKIEDRIKSAEVFRAAGPAPATWY